MSTQNLVKGYVATNYDANGVRTEKLFAVESSGKVLETEWKKYNVNFGKRYQFKDSGMTLGMVKEEFAVEFCGNYNID